MHYEFIYRFVYNCKILSEQGEPILLKLTMEITILFYSLNMIFFIDA